MNRYSILIFLLIFGAFLFQINARKTHSAPLYNGYQDFIEKDDLPGLKAYIKKHNIDENGSVFSLWLSEAVNFQAKKCIPYLLKYTEDPFYPFLNAVRGGQRDITELFLIYGIDLQSEAIDTDHILKYIARNSSPDIYLLLIQYGADPGNLPLLHEAVVNPSPDFMDFLINQGFPIDRKNKQGMTALMKAVVMNKRNAAQLLLNRGASMDITDNEGKTALIHSAFTGNQNISGLLIDEGADIFQKDSLGYSWYSLMHKSGIRLVKNTEEFTDLPASEQLNIFLAAITYGWDDIITHALTDSGLCNSSTPEGDFPLAAAVEPGDIKLVQALLDAGADINKRDEEGNTALALSARKNNYSIGELLIKKGANINLKNNLGETPFIILFRYTQVVGAPSISGSPSGSCMNPLPVESSPAPNYKDLPDLLEEEINRTYTHPFADLLLQYGADINEKDSQGFSALLYSIMGRSTPMYFFLMKRGADYEVATNTGQTPLMMSAALKQDIIFFHLLESGAALHKRDKKGFSALTYGADSDVILYICLKYSQELSAQHPADRIIMKDLWQKLLNTNRVKSELTIFYISQRVFITSEEWGNSPLFQACEKGNTAEVKKYLNKDVDVNKANLLGQTPLMIAATHNSELFNLILSYGGDIHKRDIAGHTALQYAAAHNNLSVIQLLIKNGINRDARDFSGNTILHTAAATGSVETVEWLIQQDFPVNISNKEGLIPLYSALEKSQFHSADILVVNGGNIFHEDDKEWDALFYTAAAVINIDNTDEAILFLKKLISKGADPERMDSNGQYPWEIARDRHSHELAFVLNSKYRHHDNIYFELD